MDQIGDLQQSLGSDDDDVAFMITENRGQVAMPLIEAPEIVYSNKQARKRLKEFWPDAHDTNLQNLIPEFARELEKGEISIKIIP